MTAPPECAEAPKLCECCGCGIHGDWRPIPNSWAKHRNADARFGAGKPLCWQCRTGRSLADIYELIRARRSQLTPTPGSEARPIQAGDWVECVDEGTGMLVQNGQRYRVQAGAQRNGLLLVNDSELLPSRFKRVDGQHPTEAMAPAAPPKPWTPSRPGEPTKPVGPDCGERAKPTCSECKAPAVLRGDLCTYCSAGTSNGYKSRQALDAAFAEGMATTHASLEARKRLAAIEQKRPRVNAAERAMLERGHPAMWPSNEGED